MSRTDGISQGARDGGAIINNKSWQVFKMVAKTEEVVTSKLDSFKLLLAIAVLLLVIVGFSYYEAASHLSRVLGVLFAVMVALAISSTTRLGPGLIGFGRSARMWEIGRASCRERLSSPV